MKKIAIVCSLKDTASINISSQLKEIGVPKWANYYEFDFESIFLPLDKIMEKNIIVLSKHQSKAGKISLTTHSIGNFSKAEFGGIDKKLCGTLPKINTNILRTLNKKNYFFNKKFLVCFEATHHGPFTEKNVSFIELGSSKKEWNNLKYARIIAESIIDSTLKENDDKIVIGIGGGHYAPDFTKLSLRKNYSFGHICPSYQLDFLDENLLEQMISKSKAEEIILDWKGLKQNKKKVVGLCKNSGIKFERVQKLLK